MTDKKYLHFVNVTPFFPKDVPYMAEQTVRIFRETGLTDMAYCLSLHPEGTPAEDKANLFIQSFAALREALRSCPEIRCGILIQSIMGHGWSGSVPLTNEPWEHTVLMDGTVSSRQCYMDRNFRQYILKAVGGLARSNPAFFLVDDDFCIKPGECFCPLHMAEYNRKLGGEKEWTREKLVEYIRSHDWQDPVVKTVSDVLYDGLVEFAGEIRNAIDQNGNPGIRCGMCCPWAGHYRLQDIACALAGDTEPFVRIANATYCSSHPSYISIVWKNAMVRRSAVSDRVKDIIDEADTFPHTLYSESSRMMHTHIVCGLLHGLNGAKLWIANYEDKDPSAGRAYEKILAENMGKYKTLLDILDGVQWYGAVTPLPDTLLRYHPCNPTDAIDFPDFISEIFYRFGLPGDFRRYCRDGVKTVLLSGKLAEKFSDSQLLDMLHGNVLLDADAVRVLAKRGLQKYTGVEVGTRKDFFFTAERASWKPDYRYNFMWDESMIELLPICRDVEAQTVLYMDNAMNRPGKAVAPGMTFFVNEFGGKVVALCWCVELTSHKMLRVSRKEVLEHALNFLCPDQMSVYLLDKQDALIRHGRLSDGSEILAIVNINADPLECLHFHSERKPVSVERLVEDGDWKIAEFHYMEE